MKKLILLIVLVVFVATPAFAANTSITAATDIGGSDFTPSTNVTVIATATISEYAAASAHLNGSKYYTTTSEASTLGDGAKDVGTAVTTSEMPALPSATGT